MAKKTLNEATIRRFQKLAKVAPLTETYYGGRDDKKMEDAHMEGAHQDTKDENAHMQEEMHDDADPAADDMDDMDASGGQDVELTDEEARLLIDLGEKLAEAMDDEDEAEEAEEVGTELAAADADAEVADAEEADEDPDLMEALAGISYVPSQAEIVNEVAQRVAKRLKAAKLHEAKLNRALGRK